MKQTIKPDDCRDHLPSYIQFKFLAIAKLNVHIAFSMKCNFIFKRILKLSLSFGGNPLEY